MTTTDLWKALEQVLRDKGATDAWIEYALPDLQVAATSYAAQSYGNGHDDARTGWPLPNPGDEPPMNIVTEPDGSRWLELLPEKSLNEHIAEAAAAQAPPLPPGMLNAITLDTPEARAKLAEAFRSVGAAERGETWPDGAPKRRTSEGNVLHGCEMCDGEDECTCPGNVNGRRSL